MIHRYSMGVVGNCSYMAYIDTLGEVSWLCMPRFDSKPIFASLLADSNGGTFKIVGVQARPLRQYYLNNTNILCTEVATQGGHIRITDFAPRFQEHGRRFRPNMLFRKVEPIEGNGTTLSNFSSWLGHSWICFRSTLNHTRLISARSISYAQM